MVVAKVFRIVVVFVGPHHEQDPFCIGGHPHEGRRCFSRINVAIVVAKALRCPLLVCGDSNGGDDVRRFVAHAAESGVETVAVRTPHSNTAQDATAAVTVLATDERFAAVTAAHLVTDWWHMLRVIIQVQGALREAGLLDRIALATHAVLGEVPSPVVFLGELKGAWDAWKKRPNVPWVPARRGKPDEAQADADDGETSLCPPWMP